MARLTWENVAAPDFSGAREGYAAAAGLFNKAIESARDGVEDFQRGRQQAADNEVLNSLLKYQGQDPAVLEREMADGTFQAQFDPKTLKRMSAGARQTLLTQPGKLLEHAVKRSEYEQGQVLVADRKLIHDNPHIVNPLVESIRAGKPEVEARLRAEHPEFFAKVNAGMLMSTIDGSQDLRRSGISNDQSAHNLGQDVVQAGRETVSYEVGQKADKLETELTGMLPEERLGALNRGRADYIARFGEAAYGRVIQKLDASAPGAGGSGGGGGAGGITGAVYSADTSSALTQAATDLGVSPVDLATIISYETGGKFDPSIRGGKNNKHIGLIQFGEAEQAEYGAAQGQTFAQQLPAVVKYLKARGARPGDDITTLYKIINGGNRDANINASDGNGTIGGHVERMVREHGANAAAFLNPQGATVASQTVNRANISSNGQGDMARVLNAAWQNNGTAGEIAQALTGKGGQFAGEDAQNLTTKIKAVADKYNISPAVAGEILKKAHDGRESGVSAFFDGSLNPFSDGLSNSWNEDQIEELAKLAQDRKGLATQAAALDTQVRSMAATEQGNARVAEIQARIDSKIQRALERGVSPNLDVELKLMAAAKGQQVGAIGNNMTVAAAGTPSNGNAPASRKAPAKAPAKASPKKAAPPVPTASVINSLLTTVRETAKVANSDGAAPGLTQMRNTAANNRAVTAAVDAAIASGLAQFKGKNREQVKAILMRR